MLRVVSVLSSALLVVFAAGCADTSRSDPATSAAATSTSGPVTSAPATTGPSLPEISSGPVPDEGDFSVERDLVFMTVDGRDHLIDVYVPDGEGPWPVAVVFHGRSSEGKDTASTTSVAEAAAAAGVVVFAPTWYTGEPFPLGIDDIDHLADAGNCAVAFARAHAVEHGGDPARIVVYGFSAGTGPALVSALDPAEGEIPGCRSSATGAPVAGAVLGDGETFWHSAAFDGAFGEDLDAMQDSVASLTDPTRWPADLDTEFFVWAAAEGTAPRDVDDPTHPAWLAERDPAGSIRSDLERLDQLADGVVSYIDAAQLLELRLREAGVDVSLEITPGGHSVAEKLPLLVDWLLDASS